MSIRLSIGLCCIFLLFSGKKNSPIITKTQQPSLIAKGKSDLFKIDPDYIDTTYTYTDTKGRKLVIQNSTPKGGLPYYDANEKEYIYFVFWTRITNESDDAVVINMNFPENSLKVPTAPDANFNLVLPKKQKMIPKYVPFFLYGIGDVRTIMDHQFGKPSSFKKKIKPNSSVMFYVVALSDQRRNGVEKAGLNIDDKDLVYTIKGKPLNCGQLRFID
ncbi:hypothetical protein ACJD0Z_12095 [Flavobacteriaceae bacterium M23B6Z8]